VTFAVSDAWILTKRNLLMYVRKPDLLVFSTVQPIMFVLLFVFVFGGAMEAVLPPTVPYVDFLMPGIFVQTAIFGATQTGVGLAEDLSKGLIDRFRSLPMARSAVLAGRTASDTVRNLFVVLLMLGVGYLVGFRFHGGFFYSILAILGALSVGFAFSWVSAFIGLAIKDVEAVQAASFTWIFPLTFASSAFVPSDTFPTWLQVWSDHNPVTIWVETLRALTLGPLDPAGVDLGPHLLRSVLWFLGILVVFVPLSIRTYRRT
jgi:ABC-2 type transport system permease protein/oleandomycin transport system permease protein